MLKVHVLSCKGHKFIFFDDFTEENAPDEPITATVIAQTTGGVDVIEITILPPSSDYLNLTVSAVPNVIYAEDNTDVALNINLKDNNGVAIPNRKIDFTTDIGLITQSPVYTDMEGKATT